MVSLYLVGAEANTCAPWGGARSFIFYFFSVVNEPFDGCQMQEEYMISFCVMRLLSLSSILREFKRGAESALERFEELQKEFKKCLSFVGSAVFSLVV